MRGCYSQGRTLTEQGWRDSLLGSFHVRNEVGLGVTLRQPVHPRPPSSMTTGTESRIGKERIEDSLKGPQPSLSKLIGSLRAFKPNETLIRHCLRELA